MSINIFGKNTQPTSGLEAMYPREVRAARKRTKEILSMSDKKLEKKKRELKKYIRLNTKLVGKNAVAQWKLRDTFAELQELKVNKLRSKHFIFVHVPTSVRAINRKGTKSMHNGRIKVRPINSIRASKSLESIVHELS